LAKTRGKNPRGPKCKKISEGGYYAKVTYIFLDLTSIVFKLLITNLNSEATNLRVDSLVKMLGR